MKTLYLTTLALVLTACTGSVKTEQTQVSDSISEPADSVVVVDTVQKPVEAPVTPAKSSDDNRFTSEQEAYDEGYINGEQEGYTDATHHLEFGYYYNDEPTYPGFAAAYMEGYEDGYHDGYNQGLAWNYENE